MNAFSPTIIEIHTTIDSSLEDRSNPYFERTMLTPHLTSTTKFHRVTYNHLGFKSWSHGSNRIRLIDDLYHYVGFLEPAIDAMLVIPPFKLYLKNIGDSFLGVHIRLPHGMERCKVTILQEGELPKVPKDVDDFVHYQNIWYATATINCLQKLKIEEITQGKGDTN